MKEDKKYVCAICGENISKDEFEENDGVCDNCYEEENKTDNKNNNENQKNNGIAVAINIIAFIGGIFGVIYGFSSNLSGNMPPIIIVSSIVTAIIL